jgi:peptidoglycan/LPS O-acetylase OafA/YrhL
VWGLAWPAVLLALALGALAFDWRAREWTPGTIEQPRREARALLALILLACAALAPPFSPWAEEEVLVILFPPCAFLAGLLLAPPEPAPA